MCVDTCKLCVTVCWSNEEVIRVEGTDVKSKASYSQVRGRVMRTMPEDTSVWF